MGITPRDVNSRPLTAFAIIALLCFVTLVYLHSADQTVVVPSTRPATAPVQAPSVVPASSFDLHPPQSVYKYAYTFNEAIIHCHGKSSAPITQIERPYRMYAYPEGVDIYISDWVYKSGGNPAALFESHVHRTMLDALAGHPGVTIYDIGANIGVHSVLFAAEGYEVHAFEPLRTNFELLECSAMMNQFDPARFRVNNYGLAMEESEACMGVGEKNMGGAWIDTKRVCDDPVPLKKLDVYLESVNRPPFLIKIDVEGNEYNALYPAREYLKNHPPQHIFSEFCPDMMKNTGKTDPMVYLQFLWDLGYIIKLGDKIVDEELANYMIANSAIYDIHAFLP